MYTLIVHIANADPIKAEVDELPQPGDTILVCQNPRERTDKEATWIDDGVTTIIVPWWRINFVQVLPDPSTEADFPLPFRTD